MKAAVVERKGGLAAIHSRTGVRSVHMGSLISRNQRFRYLFAIALASLALVLSACAGEDSNEESSSSIVLSGELTQETLETLADDAWMEAGLPGDPTPIDTEASAKAVGSGSVTILDQELDGALLAAGFALEFGATGGLTLPSSDNAIRNGTSHTLDPALTATPSETYVFDTTVACPTEGTVGLTGEVHLDVQQTFAADEITVTTGTITLTVDDLVVRFQGCVDSAATRRVWGTVLVRTNNIVSAQERAAEPLIYDIALDVDEYVQAGIAYEDLLNPGTFYKVLLRYARTGHIDAVRDENVNPSDPGHLVILGQLDANTTVNGIDCTTTVVLDNDPDTEDVTKTCTLPVP